MGPHAHPEISMHTFPLSMYMVHIRAGRWDEVGDLMATSAERLFMAGAEFVICPDNTIHQAFDHARDRSAIPWLHIADEVAEVASRRGLRKLGVLGTRFLMEGDVYPPKLGQRGISHELPDEASRDAIHRIIFDELVYGQLEGTSRRTLQNIIGRLQTRGCDGIVLGCTEIPLLIADRDSPLPTLDSTRILARAALRHSME
jgi:aspartate racemase